MANYHRTQQDTVTKRGFLADTSYERVWHPVHPALKEQGPYIVVLVEIPKAGNVRLIGNLLGDPEQTVAIGGPVHGVFEHHEQGGYTLLQWQIA